jgi:ribosomal protein L12E/L44/L45/RPP1/RPP2
MSDNIDSNSILDVFTSVEVEENLISLLSRDLSDVSIQSLLEQTKQVAGQIKH